MKIAFFEIEDWEMKYLKSKLKRHKLVFFSETLSEKNVSLVKDFDVVSVFIYSDLKGNVLEKFSDLKAVVTRSTGFDHINLDLAKKKKIKVFNVPSYGVNTVAEHTFSLILALSRKIHKSYERTIRGNFSLEGLRGFDLKGKTIGIIGLGNIGKHVARIARGFEMNILVHDPGQNKKIEGEFGVRLVSLNYLLKNSDIVSLHCPYNEKTHHMINKKNIKVMKDGAYLINTSRGGLIETKAIVRALLKKKLGGAGLDVLEEESIIREEAQLLSRKFKRKNLENLIENHLLLTFDNVIITPHNAFNSAEALRRILDVTVINIENVLNGENGGNVVR